MYGCDIKNFQNNIQILGEGTGFKYLRRISTQSLLIKMITINGVRKIKVMFLWWIKIFKKSAHTKFQIVTEEKGIYECNGIQHT